MAAVAALFSVFCVLLSLSCTQCETIDACPCGKIFITVSSLWQIGSDVDDDSSAIINERNLEMNWDNTGCSLLMLPQKIVLYDQEPDSDNYNDLGTPLVEIDPRDYPEGFYKTNISLERTGYPGGWNKDNEGPFTEGDHCYPYWIVAYLNDTLLHKQCFKIRPTWMGDHRTELGPASLTSLFLPGTHNSGSYYSSEFYETPHSIYRNLLTQDTDVWGQLVHGIRYLDLRIGYYVRRNSSRRFYVNHDFVRVRPLLDVILDIRKFLKATKSEVVILDLHRFPWGFYGSKSRHQKLVQFLSRSLQEFALPYTGSISNVTLQQMWNQNKRLIIAYGHRDIAKEHDWLWPPLKQMWGDQQTAEGLKSYFEGVIEDEDAASSRLWAAMAELTPTTLGVIFSDTTLRDMADAVNRNVTTWFCSEWWRWTNIVATDFFLGNNVVDVAIRSNLLKSREGWS